MLVTLFNETWNFPKNQPQHRCFPGKFCEIFKNTHFVEDLRKPDWLKLSVTNGKIFSWNFCQQFSKYGRFTKAYLELGQGSEYTSDLGDVLETALKPSSVVAYLGSYYVLHYIYLIGS